MTKTKNIINLDLEGVISPQKARLPHEDIVEGHRSVELDIFQYVCVVFDKVRTGVWNF